MNRLAVYSRLNRSVVGLLGLLALAAPALPKSKESQVDLTVRVMPRSKEARRTVWKVVLRNPNGIQVRETLGFAGERLTLRKLVPNNYVLCVVGGLNRRSCRSVDLHVPPQTTKRLKFDVDMEEPGPALNQADLYRVSRARLGIPLRAREEMIQAQEAQARGDAAAVRHHLEKAIELYPEFVEALNNLGNWHLSNDESDTAIIYLERATRADPLYYASWVNLGSVRMKVGRLGDALAANRRALELRPHDVTVLCQLGLNYFYLHQYADAKEYLLKVVEMDPAYANSPQLYLAQIAVAENSQTEAEQYLRGYLEIHPNAPGSAAVRRWLGRLTSR